MSHIRTVMIVVGITALGALPAELHATSRGKITITCKPNPIAYIEQAVSYKDWPGWARRRGKLILLIDDGAIRTDRLVMGERVTSQTVRWAVRRNVFQLDELMASAKHHITMKIHAKKTTKISTEAVPTEKEKLLSWRSTCRQLSQAKNASLMDKVRNIDFLTSAVSVAKKLHRKTRKTLRPMKTGAEKMGSKTIAVAKKLHRKVRKTLKPAIIITKTAGRKTLEIAKTGAKTALATCRLAGKVGGLIPGTKGKIIKTAGKLCKVK